MATVQLTLSDDELQRIAKQAQQQGVTPEAWLTAAALDRLKLQEAGVDGALAIQAFVQRASAPPPRSAPLDGVLLRDILPPERRSKPFESAEELQEFWRQCAAKAGPGREPDWEEHLKNINESRSRGLPDV